VPVSKPQTNFGAKCRKMDKLAKSVEKEKTEKNNEAAAITDQVAQANNTLANALSDKLDPLVIAIQSY